MKLTTVTGFVLTRPDQWNESNETVGIVATEQIAKDAVAAKVHGSTGYYPINKSTAIFESLDELKYSDEV